MKTFFPLFRLFLLRIIGIGFFLMLCDWIVFLVFVVSMWLSLPKKEKQQTTRRAVATISSSDWPEVDLTTTKSGEWRHGIKMMDDLSTCIQFLSSVHLFISDATCEDSSCLIVYFTCRVPFVLASTVYSMEFLEHRIEWPQLRKRTNTIRNENHHRARPDMNPSEHKHTTTDTQRKKNKTELVDGDIRIRFELPKICFWGGLNEKTTTSQQRWPEKTKVKSQSNRFFNVRRWRRRRNTQTGTAGRV